MNYCNINIYKTADLWEINRKDFLEVFIKGVKHGLFSMDWVVHRPNWQFVRSFSKLNEATTEDDCTFCTTHFSNALDDNMEVVFSLNSEIRKLPESLEDDLKTTIDKELKSNNIYKWKEETTIYAVDCFNNAVFRSLFSEETLPLYESLFLNHAAVLITDLKNSTKIFGEIGDKAAFKMMKEHFSLVYKTILNHNGVPVKTFGDSVMAIFDNEINSIKAAFSLQKICKKQPNTELRVGLHAGPLMAVNLNNRLDYFGETVNYTAKIRRYTKANEISISQHMFEKQEIQNEIATQCSKAYRSELLLKGEEETLILYRLRNFFND